MNKVTFYNLDNGETFDYSVSSTTETANDANEHNATTVIVSDHAVVVIAPETAVSVVLPQPD